MTQQFFERRDQYNVVLDVTPEMAEAWLRECNSRGRKLIKAHVDRLAKEMKAGRWQLTHQGIAFSASRVLLDGQHRLRAVIASQATVQMLVFFNEPDDVLITIDANQSRRRQVGQAA